MFSLDCFEATLPYKGVSQSYLKKRLGADSALHRLRAVILNLACDTKGRMFENDTLLKLISFFTSLRSEFSC